MFLFPDDMMRLRSVLDAALRNIHSSSHLFKLAQDAFRLGLPGEGQRNSLLLNAALELGLQVRKFIMNCSLLDFNMLNFEILLQYTKSKPSNIFPFLRLCV